MQCCHHSAAVLNRKPRDNGLPDNSSASLRERRRALLAQTVVQWATAQPVQRAETVKEVLLEGKQHIEQLKRLWPR